MNFKATSKPVWQGAFTSPRKGEKGEKLFELPSAAGHVYLERSNHLDHDDDTTSSVLQLLASAVSKDNLRDMNVGTIPNHAHHTESH